MCDVPIKKLHKSSKGQVFRNMEHFDTIVAASSETANAEPSTMEDYLISWGLSSYIEKFKEHCIDLDTLQILSADDLKDLVPVIGHRAKLIKQIDLLKNIITNAFSDHNNSTIPTDDPAVGVSFLFMEDKHYSPNITSEVPSSGQSEAFKENVPHNGPLHCKLYETLSACNEGKSLLLRYSEGGLLDNGARRRLCNLIINNELKDDPDKRINSSRLYQLAYEITEIFKKESSSVYFIPFASFSPQEKISAKGKLLDCYRQRRRDFIKSGVIKRKEKSCSSSHSGSDSLSPRPSTSVQAAVEQLAADDENEIKDKLLWLKNCCTPWETVENNWSITTKARFHLLQSELTILQYYADFKALNQPGGIFLLLKDFKSLYPRNNDNLTQNWLLLKPKIIELAKTRTADAFLKNIIKDIEHEQNEDITDLAAFCAIPLLMTTSNVSKTKSKSKKLWRPSKHEVLEGFITHVKSTAEIEETISRRIQKLQELGLTLQPFILVVGPSIKHISCRFIIVNSTRYEMISTVQAVDACFKIIFVLNAQYPAECVHVWQFIQIALFQMKTKYDKISTTTNTLLTDLNIKR